MTTLYLPSPLVDSENYVILLDEVQYEIFFTYIPCFDFWNFRMDKDNLTFIGSVTLIQGVDVAYNTNLPEDFGRLYISSLTGDDSDPNKDNFGKSVFLTYDTAI